MRSCLAFNLYATRELTVKWNLLELVPWILELALKYRATHYNFQHAIYLTRHSQMLIAKYLSLLLCGMNTVLLQFIQCMFFTNHYYYNEEDYYLKLADSSHTTKMASVIVWSLLILTTYPTQLCSGNVRLSEQQEFIIQLHRKFSTVPLL